MEPRTILGKKVKTLRKQGVLPANLFGKDFKSKAVQVQEKEFLRAFKKAGETGIVEVSLKDQVYPVLIHNVQKNPVSGSLLHVDFHKVNLKEKVTTHVPLKLLGEAPAEKSGIGLVLQTVNELEIESLPADIPHEFEIDISNLTEVGQTIHVKDLKVDRDKVEIKNDPEEVIVSVQTAEMKEEPEQVVIPAPEEVEATAEKGEEAEAKAQTSEEKKEEAPKEAATPPEEKKE